jgi:hypothetical protein
MTQYLIKKIQIYTKEFTCSVSKISRRCSRPRLFRNWLIFMSRPATKIETLKFLRKNFMNLKEVSVSV